MKDSQQFSRQVQDRVLGLVNEHNVRLSKRIDKLMLVALPFQALAVILVGALMHRPAHVDHAHEAFFCTLLAYCGGGGLALLGAAAIVCSPGTAFARRSMAIIQPLFAAMFLYFASGNTASHVFFFAVLTMLALYRDRSVLLLAAGIILVDLLLHAFFWPGTPFRLILPARFAWVETFAWFVCWVGLLYLGCTVSHRDLHVLMRRQAEFEVASAMLPDAALKLKASEERFRSLAAASPIGIFQTDSANRCIYTNEKWSDITGLSADDSLSAGWTNAIHPQDRVAFLAAWSRAVGEGREFVHECRLTNQGLEASWARCRANAVIGDGGAVVGYVGSLEDISDTKRAELQMQQAKESAEAASRAKSEFLANMSHEIRTPMTAILGYADMLLRPDLSADERGTCVKTIRKNGQHLLNVINDILDISKIEAGRMVVERIVCQPIQIIHEVAALMRGRATEKGLSFEVEFASHMPSIIKTDPTRLRQILMNLTGNAIKFTSKGYVKLRVAVDEISNPHKTLMRFDIIDTGIGISLDQQLKILLPFAQADTSTSRKFGGSGLGLVISSRLTEMLGGAMSIQSEPGKGSTFSVTIETGSLANVPMIEKPEEVVDMTSHHDSDLATLRLDGRVLVAEDGLDNQQLIQFYLQDVGLHVDLAGNGRIACDMVAAAADDNRPYDVILLDMQMPELDGYAAAAKLRTAGVNTPIIAITAHAMTGDREKCINAGCTDYITKPLNFPALIRLIKPHVREAADSDADASRHNALVSTLADNPKMQTLITNFVSRLGQRMADIQHAVEARDFDKLRILTHQLKGASAGYGYPAISDAARHLESLVKSEKDIKALAESARELAALCTRASAPAAPASVTSSAP